MKENLPNKLAVLGVIALAVLILGYRFWYPPEPYFDEVHYVKFMRGMLYDNTYLGHASQHPPFWHILMILFVELFGDNGFGWRIVSLLAHLGVLAAAFAVARKLTGDLTIACVAAFLLLFDCLSVTQARIAMMNSTMMLFLLMAIYYFFEAFREKTSYDKNAFRTAGVFWGFALITKLVALNLLFFIVPLLWLELKKRLSERSSIIKDLGVYYILFPILLTYCAFSFVPFLEGRTLADMWNIQAYNLNYNATTVNQVHSYSSRWWSWPLMLRPINFYFKADFWNAPGATCETILAIGNPVLFWSIPVAVLFLVGKFFGGKSRLHGIVLLGFLSQWLGFALASRLQFFHYFYQAMPFAALAVTLLLWEIRSWGWGGKIFVGLYLVAIAAMFVYWYPLLTGMTISREFFYQHMWFPSWI